MWYVFLKVDRKDFHLAIIWSSFAFCKEFGSGNWVVKFEAFVYVKECEKWEFDENEPCYLFRRRRTKLALQRPFSRQVIGLTFFLVTLEKFWSKVVVVDDGCNVLLAASAAKQRSFGRWPHVAWVQARSVNPSPRVSRPSSSLRCQANVAFCYAAASSSINYQHTSH